MDNYEKRGILLLKVDDEKKEIEFELNYFASLNIQQRFNMMQKKNEELRKNLEKNGHRRPSQIIKRKQG